MTAAITRMQLDREGLDILKNRFFTMKNRAKNRPVQWDRFDDWLESVERVVRRLGAQVPFDPSQYRIHYDTSQGYSEASLRVDVKRSARLAPALSTVGKACQLTADLILLFGDDGPVQLTLAEAEALCTAP